MGLLAGYGLQHWPILQDMSQLRDLYGDRANIFIANAGLQQVFSVKDVTIGLIRASNHTATVLKEAEQGRSPA